MRRVIAVGIIIISVFALTGCRQSAYNRCADSKGLWVETEDSWKCEPRLKSTE